MTRLLDQVQDLIRQSRVGERESFRVGLGLHDGATVSDIVLSGKGHDVGRERD